MNKKLEKTFDLPSMEEVFEGHEQDNTESKTNDLGHDTSTYKSGPDELEESTENEVADQNEARRTKHD